MKRIRLIAETLAKSTVIGLIIFGFTAKADPYIDYMNGMMSNFNTEFSNYNALVVDTSAAMIAVSNIDFFKHEGWSGGFGVATIHTEYGNGNAYALGVQYGYKDIAINMKGSYKGSNEFIIGTGMVIGF